MGNLLKRLKLEVVIDASYLFMRPATEFAHLAGKMSAVGIVVGSLILRGSRRNPYDSGSVH